MKALIVSPTPPFPTNAGNRKRILDVSKLLIKLGYQLDFVYFAIEDYIYAKSGSSNNTDLNDDQNVYNNIDIVPVSSPKRLTTRADFFFPDDWYDDTFDRYLRSYFAQNKIDVVLVNYVFMGRSLGTIPKNVLKIVDTHDRFGGRNRIFRSFRAPASFFYMRSEDEIRTLSQADIIICIQEIEAKYFSKYFSSKVVTLGQPVQTPGFSLTKSKNNIFRWGFIGHGNDANIISLRKFFYEMQRLDPSLFTKIQFVVAGEVCEHVQEFRGRVELMGKVDHIKEFYSNVSGVFAPLFLGTGLKVKVIEALSLKMPVLATLCAFEGIQTDASVHQINSIESFMRIFQRMDDILFSEIQEASWSVADSYEAQYQREEEDFAARLLLHPNLP